MSANDDDDDDVFPASMDDEMEIEREEIQRRAGGFPSPPASVRGGAGPSGANGSSSVLRHGGRIEEDMDDDDDDEFYDDMFQDPAEAGMQCEDEGMRLDDDGRSNNDDPDRLTQQLNDVPGWSPEIMGDGLNHTPTVFACGLSASFVPYSEDLWANGQGPIPARLLVVNVPLDFIAKDGRSLAEFEQWKEGPILTRAVAISVLLGIMSAGTSKRLVCSDSHVELANAIESGLEGEDFQKFKKKLHGALQTYSWLPFANDDDLSKRSQEGMMFGWVFEETFSPGPTEENPSAPPSQRVGLRIIKSIYDPAASCDVLARHLLRENSEVARAGQINGMPEAQRSEKMVKQNKQHRVHTDESNMSENACTMYKRACNLKHLEEHMITYAGATEHHNGRPLYANFSADLKPGCISEELKGHDRWGGQHCLGPSIALNFKRFQEADGENPGVNVMMAGMVDTKGNLIDVHPEQADPRNYFDAEGRLRPPPFARDKFFFCHDPCALNIFNIPFPRPVHGNIVPDDVILEMYWDLHKDTDHALVTKQNEGLTTFEQNKETLLVCVNNMMQQRDQEREAQVNAILSNNLMQCDSIDKSPEERDRLSNLRCYHRVGSAEEDSGDGSGSWVVEPRQVLKEISIENVRAYDLVDRWNRHRKDYIYAQKKKNALDESQLDAEEEKRTEKFLSSVRSVCKIGLHRFEHAYSSKNLATTIPPGYRDIAHKGLHEALREAGSIGQRKVTSENGASDKGTANLAFAHGHQMTGKDMTPWAHWRAFLMHSLSGGAGIAGEDVRIMLELWTHAFEPFLEVSFFYLM